MLLVQASTPAVIIMQLPETICYCTSKYSIAADHAPAMVHAIVEDLRTKYNGRIDQL